MFLVDCIKVNRIENKSFFNRDRIFKISERSKLNNNTYLYWLKENGRKKKKIFKASTIRIERSICRIMELIFLYFKETPLGVENRFTLDFSNNELIYQTNFSTEND